MSLVFLCESSAAGFDTHASCERTAGGDRALESGSIAEASSYRMNSLSTSITHTVAKNAQVPAQKMPRGKRYGMLPDDVMANPELSPAAKVVLSGMAMESYSTGSVAISHQAIAAVCGIVRRTVGPALVQLQGQKLIQPLGSPIKQIQAYQLLHPKHAARIMEVQHSCAKCGLSGKKLNKACHCQPCAKTIHPKVFVAVAAKEKERVGRLVSAPRRKAS